MIAPFKPRDPRAVLLVLLAVGLFLAVLNADLPFIKNSVVYIKAVSKVVEGEITLGELLADPNANAYQKPLGVVLSFLPFVALFGYHVGPIVHSYATTALFALAALAALRRLGRRLRIPDDRLGAMLAVTFLNPVAIYQFWAVGPDALFAAAFLASFALLDRALGLLEAPSPGGPGGGAIRRAWPWVGLYLLSLYATVTIKFYGLAALPIHAVYAWAMLRRARIPLRPLAPFALPIALLLACIAVYPGGQMVGTKDFAGYVEMTVGAFDGEEGGMLAGESRFSRIAGNVELVAATLLVSLNALVVCLFRRYRREEWPIAAIAVVFVVGLVLHRGTFYNMRFLLPIAPFVAALAVGAPRFANRRLVGVFVATGAALVLLFNVPNPAAAALTPRGNKGSAFSVARGLKLLNNLRLGSRMQGKAFAGEVERLVPPGAPIVFVTHFFGDAYFGMGELTGSFEPKGEVRYAKWCREVEAPAGVFYLIAREKRCELPFAARREELVPRLERVTVLRGPPGEAE